MTPFDEKYYNTSDIKDAIKTLRSNIAIDFAMLNTQKEQNASRKIVRKQMEVLQSSIYSIDYLSCSFVGSSQLLGFHMAFRSVGLNFSTVLNCIKSYTREQAMKADLY